MKKTRPVIGACYHTPKPQKAERKDPFPHIAFDDEPVGVPNWSEAIFCVGLAAVAGILISVIWGM